MKYILIEMKSESYRFNAVWNHSRMKWLIKKSTENQRFNTIRNRTNIQWFVIDDEIFFIPINEKINNTHFVKKLF